MKKQTIEWIQEVFEEDSKNYLSERKKEAILKNLNAIDVGELKLRHKDKKEVELARILKEFDQTFEIFTQLYL